MPDYMKEAKRLAVHLTHAAATGDRDAEASFRAALLAHIQRGAVPEGWRIRRDRGAIVVDHPKIGGYAATADSESIAATILYEFASAMLAAAPAPDHFRDATEMVVEPAEVKLYAWRPSGHGEYSFYVASTSEEAARIAVQAEVDDLRKRDVYGASGWGTDYYTLECVGLNEVMTNDND